MMRVWEKWPLVTPWLKDLGQICAVVRHDRYAFATAANHEDGLQLLREFANRTDPLSPQTAL